jgi:pimeloyl-[acyl-carrier protein] methyl ester esterase
LARKRRNTFTLHGWSFDASVWRVSPFKYAEHLLLPGHSSSNLSSTELLQLAEEVACLLPNSSELVGWSLGASVAVLVAALFPQKVERLVLYAPTLSFTGISQPEVVVKRFLKKLKRDFPKTVKEFRKLCSWGEMPVPELDEGKATLLLESFCRLNLSSFAPKVKATTAIVIGKRDEVTGTEGAKALFGALRCKKEYEEADADHLTVLRVDPSPLL